MKKHLIIGLLVVITLISLMSLLVVGQGGFSSWRSINMTGVSNSYLVLDRSGVSSSHFVVETSFTQLLAPTNLALTMVSENEVLITWTMGVGACYSMVRGAVGRVPTSRTDGYLVYHGSATSATDFIDEGETVYYRIWSQSCGEVWESEGISGSTGGNAMILIAILAFCGIMSFIAMRSSFFGLKLIAGMSWFGFFIYFKDYPPSVIEEGSGAHWALLVIAIGFGLMIVLAGLGRGIEQTKDKTGVFSVKSSGGFKFSLPNWLRKASPTEAEKISRESRAEKREEYRDRIHKALNPKEKEKK